MKKPIIEIGKEEVITFDSYNDLHSKLQEVSDDTEWMECNASDIMFFESLDANPFEGFGGSEFESVCFSPNQGWTKYPLRYTCLPSILARAEINGNGIKELFLADKEKFATIINWLLERKVQKKAKMKALIQGNRLSALHSSSYKEISMTEIFEAVDDYLFDNYDDVEFAVGSWSYSASTAVYRLKDEDMNAMYQKLLSKYFGNNDWSLEFMATSSDVAESAVRFYPRMNCGSFILPLMGGSGVKHIGSVDTDTVKERLNNVFSSFAATFRNVAALADIKIKNKKNCMIKVFTVLNIPQKYAAELCEQYDNTSSNALYIYKDMCAVLPLLQKNLSRVAALNYEEALARTILWNRTTWENFDIPGVVSWGAKAKKV